MATETTTFEIKTHEHEFTELYVLLRRELEEAKGMPQEFRSYTTEDDLRNLQNYRETASTFHAKDHWYAFENGELIGYAHLWPTYTNGDEKAEEVAGTDIPGVKTNNPEVFKALRQAIIQRARELGVKTLNISVEDADTMKIEEITTHGFSKGEINLVTAKVDVKTVSFDKFDSVDLFDYDEEKHLEDVIPAYDKIGINRDFVLNQNENLRNLGERIVSWNVSYENNTLTGHSLVLRYSDEGSTGQLLAVTRGVDTSDDGYKRAVSSLYNQNIEAAKKKGLETLDLFLPTNRLELREFYEGLGFEFQESHNYTLPLDQF